VIGFQAYLIFQSSDSSKETQGVIQFEEKDLYPPDTSIQDWDPFKDFQRMQKRMDRFFGKGAPDFNSTFPNMKSFSFGGPFSQNFNLEDAGDKYIVTLELPGLDQTNIDASVEGQSLRISGNMEQKDETKKDNAVFKSHQTQHFERYLTLPGPVKPETLSVDYENTTLKISIEKNTS
jgi:HSP20 family protein